MNAWHAVTDSDAFRSFAKRGPGRTIFRSAAFRRAMLWRNAMLSTVAVAQRPDLFRDVKTFCFFVGHNKSGASMLGGLLDAHPNAIVADECDALRYVDAGLGRDRLFYLLLRGSRSEARKGRVTARRLTPYSYAVPGQWQGRVATPLLVGDSTTGTSTRRLGTDPRLLDRVHDAMTGIDVRLVHVIRNPFDPISAMMVRGGRTFENAIDHYFGSCEILDRLRERLGAETMLPVRYEEFVREPVAGLGRVCGSLGIEADESYLRACAAIVRPEPDRSRAMVRWTEPWIGRVHSRMQAHRFLEGYSYDA
jgi:hypothetical protein